MVSMPIFMEMRMSQPDTGTRLPTKAEKLELMRNQPLRTSEESLAKAREDKQRQLSERNMPPAPKKP